MKPRVGLFVTCLVDLIRPSVGFAAVRLLERAGCTVEVPTGQTCCGQPAYNSGDTESARDIAWRQIDAFSRFDYVVAPSGSCAAMLKVHVPKLFETNPVKGPRARAFAERVHELTSFLVNVRGLDSVSGTFAGRVTYHDACSGLRELGVKTEPRHLLALMPGVKIVEMREAETCCGFGGLFSVKYGDISAAMAGKKTAHAEAARADLLAAADLGCLMNIAGKLAREGRTLPCRHVAEILAGEMQSPAIGAEG